MKFIPLLLICICSRLDNVHCYAQNADTTLVWRIKEVPVCWINPTNEDEQAREWVERSINKTWGTYSSIKFVGWSKCGSFVPNVANGIRIRIADLPSRSSIGRSIVYDSVGMILNFKFGDGIFLPIPTFKMSSKTRSRKDSMLDRMPVQEWNIIRPSPENLQLFIEATAVHEFGHALGFSHEQARTDCENTSQCNFPEPIAETKPIISVTCNERSVMNYCNDIYLNEGALSHFDKELLKKYYPRSANVDEPFKLNFTVKSNRFGISTRRQHQTKQSQRARIERKLFVKKCEVHVYLTIPDSFKNEIKEVQYFFHRKTFKNMVIANDGRTDNSYRVVLTKVWGNFTGEAKIVFKNGSSLIVSNYIEALRIKRKYRPHIDFFDRSAKG